MRRTTMLSLALFAGCPATPTPDKPTVGLKESATRARITSADAEAHDLTPFDFSIDTAGTPMLATPFPDVGEYLAVSGPPGGPQNVRFVSLGARVDGPAALEAVLRPIFSHVGDDPFALGAPTEVTVGGSPRQALSFATGQSMARTSWCAILIDSRLRGAVPQLLVLVGIGSSDAPDCQVPLRDAQLGAVVGSLVLE